MLFAVRLTLVISLLALAAGCGGVTTTTTTEYDPATEKPTKKTVKVEGSVEGQAAVEKGRAIPQIVAAVQALGTTITIPRGFDENRKPLEPLILRVTDSRAYDVLLGAMDFSKFESPSVKGLRIFGSFAERAINPLAWMVAMGNVVSNLGTRTNNTYNANVSGSQNALAITPGSGNTLGINPVSQVTSGDQAPIGDGNRSNVDNGYYEGD